jgi:hypothetical protein
MTIADADEVDSQLRWTERVSFRRGQLQMRQSCCPGNRSAKS